MSPSSSWVSIGFMPAFGSSSSRIRRLRRRPPARSRAAAGRRTAGCRARRSRCWSTPNSSEQLDRALGRSRARAARKAGVERSVPRSERRTSRCSPTLTLSMTGRSPNRRMFWNVRAIPSRATRYAGAPVMSAPSKRIVPLDGRRNPGQEVEQRRLAGAVRPDDPVDRARPRAAGRSRRAPRGPGTLATARGRPARAPTRPSAHDTVRPRHARCPGERAPQDHGEREASDGSGRSRISRPERLQRAAAPPLRPPRARADLEVRLARPGGSRGASVSRAHSSQSSRCRSRHRVFHRARRTARR